MHNEDGHNAHNVDVAQCACYINLDGHNVDVT